MMNCFSLNKNGDAPPTVTHKTNWMNLIFSKNDIAYDNLFSKVLSGTILSSYSRSPSNSWEDSQDGDEDLAKVSK